MLSLVSRDGMSKDLVRLTRVSVADQQSLCSHAIHALWVQSVGGGHSHAAALDSHAAVGVQEGVHAFAILHVLARARGGIFALLMMLT